VWRPMPLDGLMGVVVGGGCALGCPGFRTASCLLFFGSSDVVERRKGTLFFCMMLKCFDCVSTLYSSAPSVILSRHVRVRYEYMPHACLVSTTRYP